MNGNQEIGNLLAELNCVELIPREGLSFLRLGDSINVCLSQLKRFALVCCPSEILVDNSPQEPIYVINAKLGLKLRFDSYFQILELIEIEPCLESPLLGLIFNGQRLFHQSLKSNFQYSNLLSFLELSTLPTLIDNDEKLLMKGDGVTFVFNNPNKFCEFEQINSKLESLPLIKILVFKEVFLKDSLLNINEFASLINKRLNTLTADRESLAEIMRNSLIYVYEGKIEIIFNNSKGTLISLETVTIKLGDYFDSVIVKLKNPNCYTRSRINMSQLKENAFFSNINLNEKSIYTKHGIELITTDYFANYLNLGIDLLVDFTTCKVKKIIIHNNSPFGIYFTYYRRSNFIIQLDKEYFTNINDESNHIIQNCFESRINSESSAKQSESNLDANENKIEHVHQFTFNKKSTSSDIESPVTNMFKNLNLRESSEAKTSSSLFLKNSQFHSINHNSNSFPNMRLSRKAKHENGFSKQNIKYNPPEKTRNINTTNSILHSNSSIRNESFTSLKDLINDSISVQAEKGFTLTLTPITNFKSELLSLVASSSYFYYVKTDPKSAIMSHFYMFKSICFEVLENSIIESVTLYEPAHK